MRLKIPFYNGLYTHRLRGINKKIFILFYSIVLSLIKKPTGRTNRMFVHGPGKQDQDLSKFRVNIPESNLLIQVEGCAYIVPH